MSRAWALALAALLAGCGAPAGGLRATWRGTFPVPWRFAAPPAPVAGRYAMVVSDEPIASAVGDTILLKGGNAIDAAVATAFALEVVLPQAGNIGGGGFLVYRAADGRPYTLDFRETAPAASTPTMYLDSAGHEIHSSITGALSAGVPGSVAGLWEMHRRFGRLPWRELIAPAIALARRGVVLDAPRAAAFDDSINRARLGRFPSSVATYFRNGRPPVEGDTLVQPDLARTLELIADSGADAFYRGSIARAIVAEMRRSGGIITAADLAGYRAKWRAPLETTYRGYHIIGMPPPSSGGVTVAEILNILEAWGPLPRFGSAMLLHVELEAMRRAFEDRNAYLGDPDFVTMPLARLTGKAYAESLSRTIDPNRASPSVAGPAMPEGHHTTQLSVVDPEGNAVSITTTLNDDFGSAVTVAGAGFLLNDEMDDFTSRPGVPNLYGLVQGEANAIAPGKRMLSAMAPTIVLDPRGRPVLVTGSPGGPRIITAVEQVISNLIDQRMTLAQAVSAPRIHDQALPDSVFWERGGVTPDQRRVLEAMGYAFRAHPIVIGDVNSVLVTPTGLEGLADPRRGGAAAGW